MTEASPSLSEIVSGIDRLRSVSRGDRGWTPFLEAVYDDLVLAHPVAADASLALLRFARYLQADATPTSGLREFLSVHRAAQLRLLVGRSRGEGQGGAQDATTGLAADLLDRPAPWARRGWAGLKREDLRASVAEVLAPGEALPWRDRSPVSTAAHPRLRRLHPDYDPASSLTHDPLHAAQLRSQWMDLGAAIADRAALRSFLLREAGVPTEPAQASARAVRVEAR